jgi:hypothetical protein
VLNKNAAQMAGRGNIDYLNNLGGTPGYDQGIGYVDPKNADPLFQNIALSAPNIDVAALSKKASQLGINPTALSGLVNEVMKGIKKKQSDASVVPTTPPGYTGGSAYDWAANQPVQGYAHGGHAEGGGNSGQGGLYINPANDPPGGIGEVGIPPANMGSGSDPANALSGMYHAQSGGIPFGNYGIAPYSGYSGGNTISPTNWVYEYGGWYPQAVPIGPGGYGGYGGGYGDFGGSGGYSGNMNSLSQSMALNSVFSALGGGGSTSFGPRGL